MSALAVEARALSKVFGLTPVLHDTDFQISTGRAVTIIGGNGSGKSTLLSMFAGLTLPTQGLLWVFDEDTRSFGARSRRRIGMMSHQSFLYPNLTARENLEFYGRLYGLSDLHRLADSWLDRVGLADSARERVRTFSRGMEQRLAAARAMLHRPPLLLLDEPFASLDSEGVARIKSILKSAVSEGCTLVTTAHQPIEIEGVDFELLEISRGQMVPYKAKEARRGRLRSLLSPRS